MTRTPLPELRWNRGGAYIITQPGHGAARTMPQQETLTGPSAAGAGS